MRAVMVYDTDYDKWVCIHVEMYEVISSCESVVKCLNKEKFKNIVIIKVTSLTWNEVDGYKIGYEAGALPDIPTFEEELGWLRKRLRGFKL